MHELKTIDDLKPASYNPRKIEDTAAAGLSKSMENFGDLSSIVFNKRTGHLVSGHQRVDQLRKLGAVFHDGALQTKDGKRFAVRVVDWDETTEKAANISANNQLLGGSFTQELQGLLDEIKINLEKEGLFTELRLDELYIPDAWDAGTEAVDHAEENLDGITATIKVKCPQDIKDDVLIYLKAKFLEVSFAGVEIV